MCPDAQELKEAKVDGPDGIVTEYYDYHIGGGISTYFKDIKGTIFAKTYTYDAYNRLLSSTDNTHVTLPSGGVFYCAGSGFGTVNEYDANGFLTKISSNTTPVKTLYEAISMNGREQPTAFKRPGGLLSYIGYTNNLPTQFNTGTIQDLHTHYNYTNGNVLSRSEETKYAPKPEERFEYDAIERLTKSDVAVTISGVSGPITTHSIVTTDYDKLMTIGTCPSCYGTLSYGQIVSKSDVGKYIYSGFPTNAVKEIVLAPGSSVISHKTQDIVYNLFDKTQTITEQIGSTYQEEKMVYDASEDRAYTQQSQGSVPTALGVTRQRWYVGDYEKQVIAGNTQHIHYINSDAGLVAMVIKDASGYHYYPVFTDHLGSIVKVTDELGITVAEQNFDAWGRERNPAFWDYDMTGTLTKPTWLYRGYTGHEMLPEYGLINMNGRMYDPTNGRMLRPDNYVQDPLNTQSYNRYSYCFNNPLKYTDPSGDIVTWNFGNGGFSIGLNFTPVGVPAGFGVNVGVTDGFSLGGYGEVGPRMGGTGFGFGSTISQSFDYNFSSQTASTTTSVGAYGSIGAFNIGASASSTYDITNKRTYSSWAATAGVGVGDGQSGAGLYVGYGSNGVIWGIGGWAHTAADNRAIATKSAKASQSTQGKKGQATFIVSDEKSKAYIQSMAGRPMEEIVSGLASIGYAVTVIGEGMARVEAVATKIPNSKILNTMPEFKGNKDQVTSKMMQYNRKWILNELRSGRVIMDLGRDATRVNPSIFYLMEKNMIKNYKKLHP